MTSPVPNQPPNDFSPEADVLASSLDPDMAMENALEVWLGVLRRKIFGGLNYGNVCLRLTTVFVQHCFEREELAFCGDTDAFLIQRSPDTLLSPFAALWRERPTPVEGWKDFAPAVVVEYVSDSAPRWLANEKRDAWIAAGAEQVWVLQEATQSIEVWRPGHPFRLVRDDVFRPGGLAEGMEIDLRALFADD